jgi:hypothetical protein
MVLCHTYGNSFQKCGVNLNQTSDGEDATDFIIPKDDRGQLKAGVSFQEYVFCDNDAVTRDAQT